jgi:hypothetical protein
VQGGLTTRSTSAVESRSAPGERSTPSSGMQYKQRRLQRSVRLMRRYVCMRLQAEQGGAEQGASEWHTGCYPAQNWIETQQRNSTAMGRV